MPPPEARRLPAWVAPAIALPLALIQLAAFRWGVVTPDTVWQYRQALAGAYDDWHPAVMAALWRALGARQFGGAPILLLDIALYWGGTLALAEALRRTGRTRAVIAVLVLAVLPIPFGQMGALLKDSLLAASCLAAVGCLALREAGARRAAWRGGAAAALLILASAARINAMFATAPLLALLAPPRWRTGWRWPAGIVAGALVASAGAWVIDQALLRPHHSRPILSLVNFDFGGIIAHGGPNPYPHLRADEAARVTARCFDPNLYNPAGLGRCDAVEDGLAAWTDRRHVAPTTLWRGAIMAAPGAWAAHRLAHLNRNWRLFVAKVPLDAVYMMSEPNDEGLRFVPNRMTVWIVHAAQMLAWSPLGRPATWVALAAGLLLGGIGRASALGKALAWSALLYAGAYAIVSVAPDLRYNLWTLLAVGSATAIALARPGFAWRKALAPPLVAAAIEVAGLLM